MFWRVSFRSVVVVAALALGLTLNAVGILDTPCSQCAKELRAFIKSSASSIRGSVDSVVNAAPQNHLAGPVVMLVASDGEIIGLDCQGYVASFDTACCRSDLPVLTGFVPSAKKVGDCVSSAEIVLGLEIVRALEGSPNVMGILSEVNLCDLENPRVILSGAITVCLGRGDYQCKVRTLEQVLAGLKRLNVSAKTVDLRFARQAVVTCREPQKSVKKEV